MSQEKTAPQNGTQSVDNSASEKNAGRVPILIPVHPDAKDAKDGFYELTPTVMRALQVDYPTLDVRREVARMILYYTSRESGRWKLPMSGIRNWLDKSAGRKVGRQRVFSKKAAKVPTEVWWRTSEGWIEQGRARGIEREEGELFEYFKARVALALGEGPWMDTRNYTFMRILGEVRQGMEQQPSSVH